MSLFKGSAVAIITPFSEDGSVNFKKLSELVDFHLKNKTDAILVAGTTGEASTMTDEEQVEVVKFVVGKVKNRVPVIAGAGSNDTRHGINLSKLCEEAGADALLHVTPYYNKTSQKGLYEHFKVMANAVSIPVLLYNVPGRTGMTIAPETVALLAEIPNIIGLKDATGDLSYTCKVKSLVPRDFAIYSGNDDVVLPVLSLGGSGVISVWANVCPAEVHNMCAYFFNGDIEKAWEIQTKHKAFIDALFMETNPIPLKAAMKILGRDSGQLRLPLYKASKNTEDTLRKTMIDLALLQEVSKIIH